MHLTVLYGGISSRPPWGKLEKKKKAAAIEFSHADRNRSPDGTAESSFSAALASLGTRFKRRSRRANQHYFISFFSAEIQNLPASARTSLNASPGSAPRFRCARRSVDFRARYLPENACFNFSAPIRAFSPTIKTSDDQNGTVFGVKRPRSQVFSRNSNSEARLERRTRRCRHSR